MFRIYLVHRHYLVHPHTSFSSHTPPSINWDSIALWRIQRLKAKDITDALQTHTATQVKISEIGRYGEVKLQ